MGENLGNAEVAGRNRKNIVLPKPKSVSVSASIPSSRTLIYDIARTSNWTSNNGRLLVTCSTGTVQVYMWKKANHISRAVDAIIVLYN